MKFSIITPTHNRPEALLRCVSSFLNQNFDHSEIIVVNDSPECDYTIFENNTEIISAINDGKIIYIKNEKNYGKNYSCNLALGSIVAYKSNSHYVIFLDDDDWLATNAIAEINDVIESFNEDKSPEDKLKWLVTNRVYDNGKVITQNNTKAKNINGFYKINYFWDCMILKRFYGDATHIIDFNIAKQANFYKKIKNGKEWYYFAQLCPTFYYNDLNSTLTSGYLSEGLTDTLTAKSKIKKIKITLKNIFILILLRINYLYKKVKSILTKYL